MAGSPRLVQNRSISAGSSPVRSAASSIDSDGAPVAVEQLLDVAEGEPALLARLPDLLERVPALAQPGDDPRVRHRGGGPLAGAVDLRDQPVARPAAQGVGRDADPLGGLLQGKRVCHDTRLCGLRKQRRSGRVHSAAAGRAHGPLRRPVTRCVNRSLQVVRIVARRPEPVNRRLRPLRLGGIRELLRHRRDRLHRQASGRRAAEARGHDLRAREGGLAGQARLARRSGSAPRRAGSSR